MSTESTATVVEVPVVVEAPAAVPAAPEVLAAPATTELVVVSGRAAEVFANAASTFVPALRQGMSLVERRQAVRDVLKQVTTMDDRLNLVAGEMLYEVSENGYYKEWDTVDEVTGLARKFSTFEEYCETEHNLKKSKAHYLKRIYRKFVVELDLPADLLRDLEWSKAKELTDVITKENAVALFDKTKTMSVKQVKDMVAAMRGKPAAAPAAGAEAPAAGAEAEVTVPVKFKLKAEQAENLNNALAVAKSMTGSEVPGNNLDLICTDFLAGASGPGLSGALARLDVIVKNIERAFGVTLQIVGHDADRYAKLAADAAAAGTAPAAPAAEVLTPAGAPATL